MFSQASDSYDRIASNNANSLLQVRNAFWVSEGRKQGAKSIRARVRARENRMKPSVRTLFLGTRPSCLPSPGDRFSAQMTENRIITGQPCKGQPSN